MRRSSILPAVILMTLGLAACGIQSAAIPSASPELQATSASSRPGDADALMAQAKALATKTNDLGMLLWEGQMFEVVLAENAAAAEPQLAKARALLDEMAENERAIAALLDQVAQLDVSEELRTYAGQQKEIAELQLQGIAPQKYLLEEIETLYEEGGKPSDADLEKLFMETEPSDPDDPLAHLEEVGHASIEYFKQSGLPDRYYINNGLGGAYDTPDGQTEEEAGAFPVADGLVLEGPMATEEVPPPKMWGSFEMSLAEAMEAERSALESGGWSVRVKSSGETRGVMTARNSFWKATLTFERVAGSSGSFVVRLEEI